MHLEESYHGRPQAKERSWGQYMHRDARVVGSKMQVVGLVERVLAKKSGEGADLLFLGHRGRGRLRTGLIDESTIVRNWHDSEQACCGRVCGMDAAWRWWSSPPVPGGNDSGAYPN